MLADLLLSSFTEVESGKNDSRPQLSNAMAACRAAGAVLLIAKLDRRSRDVAFIAALMKSDVRFMACDMPDADTFRLHIEAAIAEEERRRISARTKAALTAAKARGITLGGFRGRVPTADVQAKDRARQREQAGQRAALDPPSSAGAAGSRRYGDERARPCSDRAGHPDAARRRSLATDPSQAGTGQRGLAPTLQARPSRRLRKGPLLWAPHWVGERVSVSAIYLI